MTSEITNYLFIATIVSIYGWGIASFLFAQSAQRIMLAVTAALLVTFAYLAAGMAGLAWLCVGGIGVILCAWVVLNVVGLVITAKIRRTHGALEAHFISPVQMLKLIFY